MEYEEESTSAEVGSKPEDSEPTFFTPPQLSTSAHLSASMLHIPPFGQRHALIVMTPPAVADVPRAVAEGVLPATNVVASMTTPGVTSSTFSTTEVVPVAPVEPVSQRVELPVPEPEPQICVDVIDCDAVITISSSLLAAAEPLQTVQSLQPAQ